MTQNGDERIVKEERVKRTMAELMRDPRGSNSSLTLEPEPIISSNLNKGKGIVFSYNEDKKSNQNESTSEKGEKLLKDAIGSGIANSRKALNEGIQSDDAFSLHYSGNPSFFDSPTDYRIGFYEAGSSGKSKRSEGRLSWSNCEEKGRGGDRWSSS
ncbi:unnamed protein product [Arabis nemorensis]|uniref:Uncharacterized protein n=1 Tax=Arabis nemorensis TaxID=586526 RepID=A0A565BKB7_9BRAS|nr:unnamed protein product [Arabis nemorensis]